MSTKEMTINISNIKAASNTEVISKEKIGKVVVRGRVYAICLQTLKSLKEIKIKKI